MAPRIIYANGTYEVNLDTEAQNITLDFRVDVRWPVDDQGQANGTWSYEERSGSLTGFVSYRSALELDLLLSNFDENCDVSLKVNDPEFGAVHFSEGTSEGNYLTLGEPCSLSTGTFAIRKLPRD